MNVFQLEGCRSDTLLGYLKALGILRLVASQDEPLVRGAWKGEVFQLVAPFERPDLEAFFFERYAPTPILNPWNNGAGFDGVPDKAASIVDLIRKSSHPRWASYRAAIALVDSEVALNDRRQGKEKADLVQRLRARYADEALPWLDAAIVIGREGAAFSFLLGSGGNDGRLDFSRNFAARALDVVGDTPLPESRSLLRDALDDTSESRLIPDAAIGQLGPRFAGGVNGTSGFNAASLVNPWDLILAIEGAVCFCGSLAKRLPSGSERVSFPFAFKVVAGGYASASPEEELRGEVWLPVWSGAATFAAVSAMLRAGRADMPAEAGQPQATTALSAAQAAQAALTLGAARGIERFERMAFAPRNGRTFTATHAGTVHTAEDAGIALLSRGATVWVERVRSRQDKLGKAFRDGLHRFETALFSLARSPKAHHEGERRKRAAASAEVLAGLADMEYALARRGHDELRPLEYLDAALFAMLDDGSLEHRIAVALVSLGFGRREREVRLRLEHVRYDEKGHLEYRPDARISNSRTIESTLGDICERRVAAAEGGDITWLRGPAGIDGRDLAALSECLLDKKRLALLIKSYSIIQPPMSAQPESGSLQEAYCDAPPAAFALIKLVLDNPRSCDRRIVALLRSREPLRALELALQRARSIPGLPAGPRNVAVADVPDAQWYAAAALVPVRLEVAHYALILNAALSRRVNWYEVEDYLNSIRREKENH
jgi:CRISPR-associated protein Csx17